MERDHCIFSMIDLIDFAFNGLADKCECECLKSFEDVFNWVGRSPDQID
jgi:hypothetical protein